MKKLRIISIISILVIFAAAVICNAIFGPIVVEGDALTASILFFVAIVPGAMLAISFVVDKSIPKFVKFLSYWYLFGTVIMFLCTTLVLFGVFTIPVIPV